MPHRSRTRLCMVAALGTIAAVGLTACSSSKSSSSAADDPNAKVTLTIGLFGTFGFKEAGLYDQYMKEHPNVTIKEDDVEQSADYWTRLKTRLASGSGLDDVQGIEIGFVSDVVQNHANQFVDFASLPEASSLKSSFYDWKWQQASTSDGKTVGLGTDTGPEAICYRPDLLRAAGLPSDGATLATKWSSWSDYIDFGKQYEASKTKAAGSHFVDSAASIFSTAVYQGNEAYDNAQGQPDVANSDGVKNAWNYATQAAQAKLTAGLQQFATPWNKAFSNGAFATIACPTWMMGYPGPGRAGQHRQVERGPGAAGRRHQLGRLVAGRAQGVQAPEGRRAAGRMADQQGPGGQHVDQGRPLAVQQPGRGRPERQGRHRRLLLQRPGGPDLRGYRGQDEDPADRPLRHPDPAGLHHPADQRRDQGNRPEQGVQRRHGRGQAGHWLSRAALRW